uniref:DNA polymerase zeta catalytic subunit n=1 Tax=Stomoxys calcitrans TaxID=35570 RepID=A0A1I8QAE6_STOCA
MDNANNEGIFSLRLVIADFYMEKPVPGLDPVYSEFRGKEIKRVPIIRVFGSNAQGQKTCMHVHGVFPYFYVPYDQKDFESVNKAVYQLAMNLDKAINVSLSQGSSGAQHVFKVQLVKGIPFYGYHRSEHQYLKIYMFNPRFVRRAANLLQNGAIMNKNFHPHEAHVPYVLQFMIDYNLYGMSFIHVPLEIVKFRRSDANELVPFKNLKQTQILDNNVVKKVSCSTLECDIGSSFILNRFQLVSKSTNTAHSNPGIESIWNDEKLRRQKMAQTLGDDEEKLKAIPALEVPATQDRPNIYPTESETFYRTALLSKLLALETSALENTQLTDQTINCTLQSNATNASNINLNLSLATAKQQKRTFNLTKMLQNSVYPEECSQKDNLINASFVANHLSNNNAFQQSLSLDLTSLESDGTAKLAEDESIFLEETIVDEELVLNLTQSQNKQHVPHNATLRDEDVELLDILQQLEDDNNSEKIDLDSSLAPLSQAHNNLDVLSPQLLDKETTAAAKQQSCLPDFESDHEDDEKDDDNIHDFSVALENLDDLILKLTQTATETSILTSLPQTDGSDDVPRTPTKSTKANISSKTPPRTPTTPKQRRLVLAGSPTRSPRTPKSGHKYKPLPLIITNLSTGKKIITSSVHNPTTPSKPSAAAEQSTNLPLASLRKKLALTELRRKSISLESNIPDIQNEPVEIVDDMTNNTKRRSTKRMVDLDKTHVTCNLTPRRTNEKFLKVYNVESKSPSKEQNIRNNVAPNTMETTESNSTTSKEAAAKDIPQQSKDSETKTKTNAASCSNYKVNPILVPSDDDNDEIIASDSEAENVSFRHRKTPNLKRLRRSFLMAHSVKRRKMACSEAKGVNSSKFLNHSSKSVSDSRDISVTNTKTAEEKEPSPPHITMQKELTSELMSEKMPLPCSSQKYGSGVATQNYSFSSECLNVEKEIHSRVTKSKTKCDSREEEYQNIQQQKPKQTNVLSVMEHCAENCKTNADSETLGESIKTGNCPPSNDVRKSRRNISNQCGETSDHPKYTKPSVLSNTEEKVVTTNEAARDLKAAEGPVGKVSLNNKKTDESTTSNGLRKSKRNPSNQYGEATCQPNNMRNIKTRGLPNTEGKAVTTYEATEDLKSKRNISNQFYEAKNIKTRGLSNSKGKVVTTKEATEDLTATRGPVDKRPSSKKKDLEKSKEMALHQNHNTNSKPSINREQDKSDGASNSKLQPKNACPNVKLSEGENTIKKCQVRLKRISEQYFPRNHINESLKYSKDGELPMEEQHFKLASKYNNSSAEGISTSQIEDHANFKTPDNLEFEMEKSEIDKSEKQNESVESMENLRLETEDSLESENSSKENSLIVLSSEETKINGNKSLSGMESLKTEQQDNDDNIRKALLKLSSLLSNDCLAKANEDSVKSTAPSFVMPSPSLEFIAESPPFASWDDEIGCTPTPPMANAVKESKTPRLCEKSIDLNSPLLFTQNSSPYAVPQNKEVSIVLSSSNSTDAHAHSTDMQSLIVLTPLDLPPNREEVIKGCSKLKIPEYKFQQPFYSNPDDVTKHKEVGFTILQINSNKLNDLEEFQSVLGGQIKGLTAWRRQQLALLGGLEMLTKYRNSQRIREYFASQKRVSIEPQINAPSRQDAKLWLKARELMKSKGNAEELEQKVGALHQEDSPIKIRRQKVTMMLNAADSNGSGEDSDNSLDTSSMSLTLTPLTPGTPVQSDLREKLNKSFTPVTTKFEKIPLERLPSFRRRDNRRVLRRVSLNQKLRQALEKEANSHSRESSQGVTSEMTEKCKELLHRETSSQSRESSQGREATSQSAEESVIPHSSQNSETSVSSQTALAEMERSSFVRQIAAHDVTMAGNESTLNSSFGFKVALENLQEAKADIEFNYLTIITLEVFVATREDLFPNPQIDEIRCLFYAIENSIPNDHIDNDKKLPRKACGYIMVHDPRDIHPKEGRIHGLDSDLEVTIVQSEVEALESLLGLCARWDPDIYAGYEIEMSSWGFIIDRAKYLCLNIAPLLSRVPSQKTRDFVDEDREQFTDLDVEMKLCGRILLDVWRLMRSEIALTSYTFENVMYHILHKRCPCHSFRSLTEWYFSPCSRWIVLEYFLERVRGTLALLDQLDLIGRTSEMAKLIGIQFYEVLSRGSQFRVESMMLRIAKPKNLVPLSPSVQQRAHMRAPEYLPLILEPQSRFYADPLIVLDFQSLYPSMIIGYNYCFSTCLGRVEHLGQSTPFEFGASQLRVSPAMLRKLVDRDLITISPCGVVFVKSSVREGILPRMLTEILNTRQMVKQSMKLHKSNSALQRILHSRQLGLKLMANVTYGYTAANFSGRMPAVEVGDSVVAKGRETLERAIKTVEANENWNVKVVYGDTDSLFVLVPGRNREEAFRIGEEIAEVITKNNPQPVKLKLEKVYQPCILQTKKRYVGYMYETADQKEPVYEAKGIETVRRDGCPMVAKMLEKVLRILFETADVSQVKQYVCRQFTKLLSGRANLQDLIFAKEFRGLNGYKPSACVPALELTRKWIQTDPRRIPRRGERVPFIITNGPPGVPLIRLIRHPHEVLADEGLKINGIYYITKAIIPPLNRCLLLIGADVNEWFTNLPRKILMTPALSMANEVISTCTSSKSKKSTISQFFSTTNCIVDCGRQTKLGICETCTGNATRSMVILQTKMSKIERGYLTTQHICQACCGRVGDLNCSSLDCPVLYVLEGKRRDLQQIVHYRNLVEERF